MAVRHQFRRSASASDRELITNVALRVETPAARTNSASPPRRTASRYSHREHAARGYELGVSRPQVPLSRKSTREAGTVRDPDRGRRSQYQGTVMEKLGFAQGWNCSTWNATARAVCASNYMIPARRAYRLQTEFLTPPPARAESISVRSLRPDEGRRAQGPQNGVLDLERRRHQRRLRAVNCRSAAAWFLAPGEEMYEA